MRDRKICNNPRSDTTPQSGMSRRPPFRIGFTRSVEDEDGERVSECVREKERERDIREIREGKREIDRERET